MNFYRFSCIFGPKITTNRTFQGILYLNWGSAGSLFLTFLRISARKNFHIFGNICSQLLLIFVNICSKFNICEWDMSLVSNFKSLLRVLTRFFPKNLSYKTQDCLYKKMRQKSRYRMVLLDCLIHKTVKSQARIIHEYDN